MKIILNKLSLRNFKGIKELDINFNHITNIYGENAAGKTTIFDAFCWVLFGKDSTDRKTFEVKKLDKNNKTNPKTECEVTASFTIDGQIVVFRKTLVENWVKPKGQLVPVLKGNDTACYVNDVPFKVGEYDKKVSEVLNEGIFKLITNPLYFNSLPWQDRRNVLMSIAGNITDSEVAASNPEFADLMEKLSNKKLAEFKSELSAKKKKLKDSLESIPTRIDEVNRQKPEPLDVEELKKQIAEKQQAIEQIETEMNDANEAYNRQVNDQSGKRNEINALRGKNQQLEFDVKQQFSSARNDRKIAIGNAEMELNSVNRAKQQFEQSKKSTEQRIETLNNQLNDLRVKYHEKNQETFHYDPSTGLCPTCKQSLPEDQVEASRSKLEENFNNDKLQKLSNLQSSANSIKEEITGLQANLNNLSGGRDFEAESIAAQLALDELRFNDTEAINKEEEEVRKAINTKPEIFVNKQEISRLEKELENSNIVAADNTQLKSKRQTIAVEIDELKKQLNNQDAIDRGNQRVAELEQQEKVQAQELADLEAMEFTIAQFTKAKIDMLESRINGKFKNVTFKMYSTTIEGNEVETCLTLVNGVPFSDANNAAKINAGLDIINALCDYYNAYAPIFIDNRESVNNLIDSNSQIVNLIVSLDKKLKVA